MSLNGLDSAKVSNAYRFATKASNGWFLLHYIARDEVDLLDSGISDLSGIRTALAGYNEKSPVYGFINYRGKRILLKYVPTDTSRLLQARTTVHFQTVSENFSPHHVLINASCPDDFSERAIASECPISHQSSGQNSRQSPGKKTSHKSALTYAAASAGQPSGGRAQKESEQISESNPTLETSTSRGADESTDTNKIDEGLPPYSSKHHGSSNEIIGLKAFLKTEPPPGAIAYPQLSQVEDDVISDTSSQSERPLHLANGTNHSPYSARPSTSEIFRSGLASLKPKVKLFPRPVANPKTQDHHGSSTARQKLPPGIRPKPAKHEEGRPKSSKSQKQPFITTAYGLQRSLSRPGTSTKISQPLPPPMPQNKAAETNTLAASPKKSPSKLLDADWPEHKHHFTAPKKPDRTTVKDNVYQNHLSPTHETPGTLSPEKQRLMKALQLRKKQYPSVVPIDEQSGEYEVERTQKTDSGVVLEDLKKTKDETVNRSEKPVPVQMEASALVNRAAPHGVPKPELSRSPPRSARGISHDPTSDHSAISKQQPSPANKDKVLPALPANLKINGQHKCTEGAVSGNVKDKPAVSGHRVSVQHEAAGSDSDDALFDELCAAKLEQATSLSISPSPAHVARAETPAKFRGNDPALMERTFNAHQATNLAVDQGQVTAKDQQLVSATQVTKAEISRESNMFPRVSRPPHALPEHSNYGSLPSSLSVALSWPKGRAFEEIPGSNLPGSSSKPKGPPPTNQLSPYSDSQRRSRTRGASFDSEGISATQRPSSQRRHREPVSITTQIVRNQHRGSRGDPSAVEEERSDFRESPVVIVHHQSPDPRDSVANSVPKTDRSIPFLSSRPPSRESTRTTWTRQSFEAFRLMGRRSDVKGRPPTSLSNASLDRVEEISEGKTSSRASKLFKRFSFASSGNLNVTEVTSQPLNNSEEPQSQSVVSKQKPAAIIIGDLNVQFPDSLLSKRRWVEIDAMGNLALRSVQSTEGDTSSKKKYHLSEFRKLTIPSRDRLEMPHSVVLEFISGGSLQLACEDSVAQGQMLKRLIDTHRAWLKYEASQD